LLGIKEITERNSLVSPYPIILGRQPCASGSRLLPTVPLSEVETSFLYEAWFARMKIICRDECFHDFVLLMRMELSHKVCNPHIIRWMLYKLPFGLGRLRSLHPLASRFFDDTYYLSSRYNTKWLDFSERNNKLLEVLTAEELRRHPQTYTVVH
jgi:hypothetical protein